MLRDCRHKATTTLQIQILFPTVCVFQISNFSQRETKTKKTSTTQYSIPKSRSVISIFSINTLESVKFAYLFEQKKTKKQNGRVFES